MENVSETEYTIILHVLSLGDRGAHKNVRSEFRLHPRIATSEASIFFQVESAIMSAMKLVVEPPATVGVGLCSATIRDVSQDFLHCIGAERRLKPWFVRPANYHFTGNQFERFREFLELISRFEFEFRRREKFFFERFEFLVRSCECAVACLCPRNSISNVVASVMIHDSIPFFK